MISELLEKFSLVEHHYCSHNWLFIDRKPREIASLKWKWRSITLQGLNFVFTLPDHFHQRFIKVIHSLAFDLVFGIFWLLYCWILLDWFLLTLFITIRLFIYPKTFIIYLLYFWIATRFTKVKSYQLYHIGFEQVHVPPGSVLWSRKGASLRGVNLSTAAIHRTLWNSTLRGARLHRSFASGNI